MELAQSCKALKTTTNLLVLEVVLVGYILLGVLYNTVYQKTPVCLRVWMGEGGGGSVSGRHAGL